MAEREVTTTATIPQTYSVVMDDGCGHSDVAKVACSPDDLLEAIEEECSIWAHVDLTPARTKPSVVVNYRAYLGLQMHSANYLRFIADGFLMAGESRQGADLLIGVAADIESAHLDPIAAGRTTISYTSEWLMLYGQPALPAAPAERHYDSR